MKFTTAAAVAIAAAQSDQVLADFTDCPLESDFRPLSAGQWIGAASPGWNAGNTLDAVPNEGSWNNAPLQNSTLTYVKAAGYKSVRIPGELRFFGADRLVLTGYSNIRRSFCQRIARMEDQRDMAAARLGRGRHGHISGALCDHQHAPRYGLGQQLAIFAD